MMVNLKVTK